MEGKGRSRTGGFSFLRKDLMGHKGQTRTEDIAAGTDGGNNKGENVERKHVEFCGHLTWRSLHAFRDNWTMQWNHTSMVEKKHTIHF